MMKAFEAIEKYFLLTILFLVPLVVLNLFANPFETPKTALLIFGVCLLLLIFSVKNLLKQNLTFLGGTFDLPVGLFALTYLTAAFIKTPNKMEAFLIPGGASVVIFGALFYFLLNEAESAKKAVSAVLTFSAAVAASIMLLAYSGVLAKLSFLPDFAKSIYFNLAGGYLPQVLTLAVILPLTTGLLLKEKETAKKAFWAVCGLIIFSGLILAGYQLLPGKVGQPTLPSYQTSWSITVDALKESPLLGFGPGNYLTAFNRLRPIAYNSTDLWATRFSTATSYFFTHVTETGLLGLAVFVLIVFKVYGFIKRKEITFDLAALVISLGLLLLLPATTSLLFLFFVLLAVNAKTQTSKLPLSMIALPALLTSLALGYLAGRGYLGEYTYKKALNALIANDGKKTYDTLRAAVSLNPYVDRYHASYTQVIMALARGLSQKAAGPEGATLTEEERNTVSQLVSQAITEAKATASLNRQRSVNWEVLARTYRAIMPFATGADTFAIQTFNQAVALDPFNPNLRIAFGGVYYALGRFDEAIALFGSAVQAKSDLANAHYNLSAAYREKGEIDKAIEEMKLVLTQVTKDSADYQLAESELADLEKNRASKEAESTESLTPPQELEPSNIKPPLELPSDSEPPRAQEE